MSKYPNWPIVMLTDMWATSPQLIKFLDSHEIYGVWHIGDSTQKHRIELRFKTATDAAMACLLLANKEFSDCVGTSRPMQCAIIEITDEFLTLDEVEHGN